MKKYTLLGLLFLLFGAINALSGTYSGGDGTSGNPYQISKTADLIELANTSGDWSKHFVQTANIAFNDDSSQVDWDGNGTVEFSGNDQYGFSPIGNSGTNFTGSYNGQNYTISNLYIKRETTSYIGLFGRTGSGSSIGSLALINVYIKGQYNVGGLSGYNDGSVSGCYSSGAVSGSDYVGGLLGFNDNGSVSGCYSSGAVSGSDYVGGLVGWNYGSVSGCYSSGTVSGSTGVGGLVGWNMSGTVISCYWDTETSGQSSSASGTGKTTTEMKTQATFSGWDFSTTWNIGSGNKYRSYPYLKTFTYDVPETDPAVNPIPGLEQKYSGGDGTSGTPYQIATTADLIELSNTSGDWTGKHFVQTANIAFNDDSSQVDWDGNGTVEFSGNDQYGFSPIGNSGTNFTGSYNGQNYTISNLYIKRETTSYIGLFGRTGSGSSIGSLALINVYIKGQYNVGGLSGYNDGSVSGCYSSGAVSGSDYVGGLLGYNDGSVISCYSSGAVSGSDYVGGLLG
ncbi:MAG TPA: GLUG motif-containing protein, partial [Candidatus Kapabacteria bacterium]|nr:GLUG motif-containing protein [Candidatus Kapabacteria bacterium]